MAIGCIGRHQHLFEKGLYAVCPEEYVIGGNLGAINDAAPDMHFPETGERLQRCVDPVLNKGRVEARETCAGGLQGWCKVCRGGRGCGRTGGGIPLHADPAPGSIQGRSGSIDPLICCIAIRTEQRTGFRNLLQRPSRNHTQQLQAIHGELDELPVKGVHHWRVVLQPLSIFQDQFVLGEFKALEAGACGEVLGRASVKPAMSDGYQPISRTQKRLPIPLSVNFASQIGVRGDIVTAVRRGEASPWTRHPILRPTGA
ncbi:hypothetical protein B0H16DRAFT_1479082 [Mycena metata]|uniref:Uncharacterized protein n=1 Tax=Mycena metata TaxID=1033252 RepID=A0AAD7H663_9AGAR|nr:hypothetical protein B0H16DRAFT_1479082 [Mycena metata]